MASVESLRLKRAQIKSKLTRFRNFVNLFNKEQDETDELQGRISAAEGLLEQFDAIQDSIEELQGAVIDETERDEFEGSYHRTMTTARSCINFGLPNSPTTTAASGSDSLAQVNVKLPTMNLPKFDGNYEQWLDFYDTFRTLIHENTSIPDVQKFYYLRSCLQGAALDTIQSLQASALNYAVAWDLLKRRFEDKALIINGHFEALLNTPTIHKESGSSLRRMVDDIQTHTRALKVLQANTWDALLTHIVVAKLDNQSQREWRSLTKDQTTTTVDELTHFLEDRCKIIGTTSGRPTREAANPANRRTKLACALVNSQSSTCPICKGPHFIYGCAQFRNLPVQARIAEAKRRKLCLNCLRSHGGKCQYGTCKRCPERHNTLLHPDEVQTTRTPRHQDTAASERTETPTSSATTNTPVTLTHQEGESRTFVFLATASIWVTDNEGRTHECRALLDSGSQSNLMTKELSETLALETRPIQVPINGVNNTITRINQRSQVNFRSRFNKFHRAIPVLIINHIIHQYPAIPIDKGTLELPRKLTLADPTFHIPGKIDILLGASVFWELICAGQHRLLRGQPLMQKTHLGWVVVGDYTIGLTNPAFCGMSLGSALQAQLERFWKIDDGMQVPQLSQEEQLCEESFTKTYKRNKDGRFIVQLPFRREPAVLGESRHIAERRLHAMERKFERQPQLKEQYTEFMKEYQQLGHMRDVTDTPAPRLVNYLPHHAVLKESSTTTKLRVVFDGSAKTTSQHSLNDVLMVGPTIQQELFAIVLRFRQHQHVITADITKMYRQVLVDERDRAVQRILWRTTTDQPVCEYELTTVTYGLGCSPFLAIRCLVQCAMNNSHRYPNAARVIRQDFYVDDLLTGADTIQEARRIKSEVTQILRTAGFELRKWASNTPALREADTPAGQNFNIGERIKTLGLWWDPAEDNLIYQVNIPDQPRRITKRSILSIISQIFDPLGLAGPATIRAKMLIQHLWTLKTGWDEAVPLDIHTAWAQYVKQLRTLQELRIPRAIRKGASSHAEIHGFCDASEKAYGACIYLRTRNPDHTFATHLLCAKARVAPLKQQTLPRLELCAALLLAELCAKTRESITIPITRTFYWSDSSIALSWIQGQPHLWKTFVANRVSQIQNLSGVAEWNHVLSEHNPADIISRGIDPEQLIHHQLWWNGPEWLQQSASDWPRSTHHASDEVPERKPAKVVCLTTHEGLDIFERYSSLSKLKRVVAYCRRFRHNATRPASLQLGSLTATELEEALTTLLRLMQASEFRNEVRALQDGRELPRDSKLKGLNPFLGGDALIRVGGRLRHSDIPYAQKHSIVLPSNHPLTHLIIRHEHYRALHAGPLALLASIREQYWPLSARSTIRKVLRRCIICFKTNPTSLGQIMGDLPEPRVVPSRPFYKCGVDYAGPFSIKLTRNKTSKAYLCLFVCFATKAIHLEPATDLSSHAFINAFKRFIARRGHPSDIYSDNGTNFKGAKRAIDDIHRLLLDEEHNQKIDNFLNQQAIKWHFNPPGSPHFGGLWEAGVKSTKTHLKRIVGSTPLTYEELHTVFASIEACLNSRPLSPISNDPSDLLPLTPGHFLIGAPLLSLPTEDYQDTNVNRVTRYELVTKLTQHFWVRWRKEYLSQLQQRHKWQHIKENGNLLGQMVIIKEDNAPPMLWRMGRIIELHPGRDNHTRVVSVATSSGIMRRPITKICPLPIS